MPLYNLDEETGYIFDVDLCYPPDLHDSTANLPFAPEKLTLGAEYLSDLMKEQWGTASYRGSQKLMLIQWDMEHYIIYGKLLQFYIKHGMRVPGSILPFVSTNPISSHHIFDTIVRSANK